MTPELLLSGGRLVLPGGVICGAVVVRDGVIVEIDDASARVTDDLEGDFLLPGLVEIHTDNMERHFSPRPGVRWPGVSAILAHDAQIAAAGITTVLDAVALGSIQDDSLRVDALEDILASVAHAGASGMARSAHLLHLRCEVSYPSMPALLERLVDRAGVRLVSVMDHTPGQRQFVRVEKYREYYQGKFGLGDVEMDDYIQRRTALGIRHGAANRRAVVDICRGRGVPMASHDDATGDHVAEALADGMVVAEFPTTVEAARLSRDGGMRVVMGGPNLVRGGSHSGNVSARALAAAGLLDIVSSDYVPNSLLESAFALAALPGITLADAVAKVSRTPAEAVGLADRGAIEVGRRADLVRVRVVDGQPVVRGVWREGRRVA